MRRPLRISLIAAVIVFVAIQLYPAKRDNPPVDADLAAPAEVKAILRRACYDCHSNETHWPWYAYVAPVSWLVTSDVEAGRKQLNFSSWGGYSAKKRRTKAETMLDQITDKEMPLPKYLHLHADAKLSAADVETLKSWAEENP